jgi:hypothetical protein
MDLTGIWQENKTFIMLVVAGLLVLIIGQVVISELYPVDTERKILRKSLSDIRRLEAVPKGLLIQAQDDNEAFTTAYQRVLERVDFKPREEFLLNPSESPDVQYFRIVSQEREVLVETPKTFNITVANDLGMPELSPTRRKDIQRALIGLDIVDRVVGLAIESNVREVGSIDLVSDVGRRKKGFIEELKVSFEMTSTMASIAMFFEKLQRSENYLAIDEAELISSGGEGEMIEADFTVSALTIVEEESEQ